MHKPLRRFLRTAAVIFCPADPVCSRSKQDTPAVVGNVPADDASEITPTPENGAKLPRASVEVVDRGGTKAVFEGVRLCETRRLARTQSGYESRGQRFSLYGMAPGSDGYREVYALPELDRGCHPCRGREASEGSLAQGWAPADDRAPGDAPPMGTATGCAAPR